MTSELSDFEYLKNQAKLYPDVATGTNTERVRLCIMRHGKVGVSSMGIVNSMKPLGMVASQVAGGIAYLRKTNTLFFRGDQLKYRVYFGTPEWAEAWPMPADYKLKIEQERGNYGPTSKRLARRLKNENLSIVQPSTVSLTQVSLKTPVVLGKKPKDKVNLEATVSQGDKPVKITRAAPPLDYRYHVPSTYRGEFIKDWEQKRSGENCHD